MPAAAYWNLWFSSLPDYDVGNRDSSVYAEAWSQETDHDEKLQIITADPGAVILAADSNKQVIALHSFKNFGGTRLRPENIYGCLIGGGSSAPIVRIEPSSLTANCDLATPTIDDISNCNSSSAIRDLPHPDDFDETTFAGCSSFYGAPWLIEAILGSPSTDPFELIRTAITAAASFDNLHRNDAEYITTAQSHIEDFMLWAWGVGAGRVPPVTYTLELNNAAFEQYRLERHSICILTTAGPPGLVAPPGPPPVFAPIPPAGDANLIHQQLVACMTRQAEDAETRNEILREQLELVKEKETKKENRLKNFHESILHMICFASATDEDTIPDEPLDSCKRFFNCKTEGLAEQELLHQLEALGLHEAGFSQGLIQALYHGEFLWSDSSTPSNFSPFAIFEIEPPIQAEQRRRHLICHLIKTQGRGRTLDEIKSSCKQEVQAPTSFVDMLEQLKFFAGLSHIFFGEHGAGTQSLMSLVDRVSKMKSTFKARERDDITYSSKFLLVVDQRFQLWLQSCKNETDRAYVNDNIINFSTLIEQVQVRTFNADLPLAFKLKDGGNKNNEAQQSKKADRNEATDNKSKKKRKQTFVTNEDKYDPLKYRTGETWKLTFAEKGKIGRVDWDGSCKLCHRWFIEGNCFTDCNNARSHVSKSEVSDEKIQALAAWMKEVRGN